MAMAMVVSSTVNETMVMAVTALSLSLDHY